MQQPSKTDDPQPGAGLGARDIVLDRMHGLGMITDKELKAAKAIPVKKMLEQGGQLRPLEPAVLLRVRPRLPQAAARARQDRPERIEDQPGRPTIQTTLDEGPEMAQAQLVKKVPIGNSERIGSAASIVEPGTGKVLAMA